MKENEINPLSYLRLRRVRSNLPAVLALVRNRRIVLVARFPVVVVVSFWSSTQVPHALLFASEPESPPVNA